MSGRFSWSIYVGNLPGDIREHEIENLFYKYGRIVDIELKVPPQPPCYCFVEFERARDAEDAIKGRDGYNFDGCRLRVELGGRGQSSSDRRGGYGGGGSARLGVSRHSEFRVIVRGLPSSASWQDLKDHMRKAGDVCFAEVTRDSDGTYGVVDYTNYDDMKYAIRKLDDTEFRNPWARAYIRVKKYESSRSLSRSKSPRKDLRSISKSRSPSPEKPKLSREQRVKLRLMHVERKKDFICIERVKEKIVNVLDGLELHTRVFSAREQIRIVNEVYQLQEKGRKGELKEHTFNAPRKWMAGKGRVTIQFGCCYNYARDRAGNPPGILQREEVDPLPPLFKVMIRRLIEWHVLPPTCVPDSCIVNIYDEGDCIPPHIDHHDFLRPFCTISFLSECNILFGSNLKIEGPGEFSGSYPTPLPVGSVLVLNGNAADVAKHCVPAVPTKRISITFRKMDESKRPVWFTPEPDLQGIEPLPLELNRSGSAAKSSGSNNHNSSNRRGQGRREGGSNYDSRGYYDPERSSEQNDSGEWSSNQRRGKPRPSRTKG